MAGRMRRIVVEVIIAGSHLRYDGVWQRPQQILSRLARRVPVLFLEEAFPSEAQRDDVRVHDGVTVVRPLRRGRAVCADQGAIDTLRGLLAGRTALLWLYTPMMLPLADAFGGSPLVYDCMDDLAEFDFAPPQMREREDELLRRATLVFAGGRSLYEKRRRLGERIRLYPSGVDFAHFARAAEMPAHPLFAALSRPVYGYFGVIDERIDLEILSRLASGETNAVMVGPVTKIDPATLPRSAVLHFTGQVPYDVLPAYLAGFDVAMMPFALNAATANISPTKTLEYLAGGKPVVSTPIADVVAGYTGVLRFANTPDGFVAACAAAVGAGAELVERGVELARRVAWDTIVEGMWRDVLATTHSL
jgi:UDP-galactopyranose mutase